METSQSTEITSPKKRSFNQAFSSSQVMLDQFLPQMSSAFATLTSYCLQYLEGASRFVGEQFSDWQSQQQSVQPVQRFKKKRRKLVEDEPNREQNERRELRRVVRSQQRTARTFHIDDEPPSPTNWHSFHARLSSSSEALGSPSTDGKHNQDPATIKSGMAVPHAASKSLRMKYTRTLKARDRLAAFQGSLGLNTSISSPIHRGLFASRLDKHHTRSSVLGARSAVDAANVLSRITPHKSRVGKVSKFTPPKPVNFPFTTNNLSHYLESPLQNSPLVNYRSPGAPLSSPDPNFNPFKTKTNSNTQSRSVQSESLADLIAQLRRDQPQQYEWHKIDEERSARNDEIARKRGLLKPARLPIPTDTLKTVEKALHGQIPAEQVLVEQFNLEIRNKDLSTLKSTAWLNDEVINFYMNLIIQRSKSSKQKVHAFNTFFYTKLVKGGYKDVRRWAKKAKVDISQCDIVLVPVHLGVHWCMSVINAKQKRFEYWDSLNGGAGRTFSVLRDYMANEAPSVDVRDWAEYIPKAGPQQRNGYDCGVFACQTAEYISRDTTPDFTQEEMPDLRKRMAASILDCQIY